MGEHLLGPAAARLVASRCGCLALADNVRGEVFGVCLMVPPAPDKQHQGAVFDMTALLKGAVRSSFDVVSGWGWRPCDPDGDKQSWTPDVTVAASSDDNLQLESVIQELLVEVASAHYATGRDPDMVTKRLAYARAGVANYWVCPDVRRRLAL